MFNAPSTTSIQRSIRKKNRIWWPRVVISVFLLQCYILQYIFNELEDLRYRNDGLLPVSHDERWISHQTLVGERTTVVKHARINKGTQAIQWDENIGIPKTTKQVVSVVNQTRLYCDRMLKPNERSHLDPNDDCKEHFPRVEPPQGVSPITVRFRGSSDKGPPVEQDCSIPCLVFPNLKNLPKNYVYIDGTPFYFRAYSMEGPEIYPDLEVNPQEYQKDHYYATISFQSDIPLPYYSEDLFKIQSPAVEFDKAIKGASFLARNCDSRSGREDLVHDLIMSPHIRVDSLSYCLKNAEPPKGVDLKNKTQVMQSYLFHLAFENQRYGDYCTEKLWGTLASGTLPVYFGAKNVKQHVPPNSIIVFDDFDSTEELALYLAKVAQNKTLYESHHAWRKRPLPESFHRKYDFTKVHSVCRMCRWAYAKMFGFGWDPQAQNVKALRIPRTSCIDQDGLLSKPMRETWVSVVDGKRKSTNTARALDA
jgi:hypothetical protein